MYMAEEGDDEGPDGYMGEEGDEDDSDEDMTPQVGLCMPALLQLLLEAPAAHAGRSGSDITSHSRTELARSRIWCGGFE